MGSNEKLRSTVVYTSLRNDSRACPCEHPPSPRPNGTYLLCAFPKTKNESIVGHNTTETRRPPVVNLHDERRTSPSRRPFQKQKRQSTTRKEGIHSEEEQSPRGQHLKNHAPQIPTQGRHLRVPTTTLIGIIITTKDVDSCATAFIATNKSTFISESIALIEGIIPRLGAIHPNGEECRRPRGVGVSQLRHLSRRAPPQERHVEIHQPQSSGIGEQEDPHNNPASVEPPSVGGQTCSYSDGGRRGKTGVEHMV